MGSGESLVEFSKPVWLVVAALSAAISCVGQQTAVSSATGADGDGDARSGDARASGAAGAAEREPNLADDPTPVSSSPMLPEVAPDRPLYEVPVTDPELVSYAVFDIGSVNWRADSGGVRLEYDFPFALSGRNGQRIELSGTLDAPDHALLSGSAGSARCAISPQLVRCDEQLTGLATDPAEARSMLSALPALEQERRGRVIESFSADPIGVLRFAPDSSGKGSDRH